MKCGGCSAAVKRMLLQQPGVAAAAVNLLTETAAVQVAAGDPAVLGPQAAEFLTAKVRRWWPALGAEAVRLLPRVCDRGVFRVFCAAASGLLGHHHTVALQPRHRPANTARASPPKCAARRRRR